MLPDDLRTNGMPVGFEQHQLPIVFPGKEAMYFLTTAQPNATFPEHRHETNHGLRVIISGSIRYEEKELTAGDWMYVPRGCTYSFTAGEFGCTIFHAYDPADPE